MSINKRCCFCEGNCEDTDLEKVKVIIEKHKEVKGGLIPVLHGVQEIYGYLPEEAIKEVSRGMNISLSEIYGVASFYHFFSLEKKGQHIIRVCLGTACYVKGAQAILNRISQELDIEVGKTSSDGKFTLEATRCLGACGLAPVMTIDDKVFGRVTLDDVRRILDEYTKKEEYYED